MADEQTDFAAILPALKEGKTVRRAGWPVEVTGMKLSPAKPDSDPLAVMLKGAMQLGQVAIPVTDILAADWSVTPEAPDAP